MHVVYERVEKEAENDPDQHKAGLDQQPPVSDVILQQQNKVIEPQELVIFVTLSMKYIFLKMILLRAFENYFFWVEMMRNSIKVSFSRLTYMYVSVIYHHK